jgi:ubiquinone/menaquinone biosynthesis C-methylase UbiE
MKTEKNTITEADLVKIELQKYWNSAFKIWVSAGALSVQKKVDEAYQKEFRQLIGNERKKVLDVGTGFSYIATQFAKLGQDVTGMDLSEKMLAGAAQYTRIRNAEVNLIGASASKLPFKNDSFDLVANRVVFWTLPDPDEAVKEWIRVTKSGGKIVIIEFEDTSIAKRQVLAVFRRVKSFIEEIKSKEEKKTKRTLSYSKETLEKLPFALRRLSASDWVKYLSRFPVDQLKIRNISYTDRAEYSKSVFAATRYIGIVYGKRLIVSCTVKRK